MATERVSPRFCGIDTWRDVVKNNAAAECVTFALWTNNTWLPHTLVEAGFFSSGSDVKRKRPDLWRDIVDEEVVKLQWAEIAVYADDV